LVKLYNLRKVFEEATINQNKLIKIMKKAAKKCTNDEPIVWQHLHTAMQKKSKIYTFMPKKLARKFGHYSKTERKTIINEMARCVRNHRSEQLTPESVRQQQIDPNKREGYVWLKDMSVLLFQEGAGADVFASVKIPEGLLNYTLPKREDTRFMYWDAGTPIKDKESHLHERTLAIESVQRAIKEDLESDNPVLDKFFVRYTLGERRAIPPAPRLEDKMA